MKRFISILLIICCPCFGKILQSRSVGHDPNPDIGRRIKSAIYEPVSVSLELGSAQGQMLYWDTTKPSWKITTTPPSADRILFWDNSETKANWLTAGTGLSIADTVMAVNVASVVASIDHGGISGLDDAADHLWALLTDGTRALAGDWSIDDYNLTSAGNITGSDVDVNAGTGDYWTSGSVTATAFDIGDNSLTTTEWAHLDGLDQPLKTTDIPYFGAATATNFIMGSGACANMSGMTSSLVIGYEAGDYASGDYNIYLGYRSGKGETDGSNQGNYNIGIGYDALRRCDDSDYNTGIGFYALDSIVDDGTGNTAIGPYTLCALTGASANYNTAISYNALRDLTGGEQNLSIGFNSGRYNVIGDKNTYIGCRAGEGITTKSNHGNTFIGYYVGFDVGTNGNYNTFIGYKAGENIDTGDYNIFIGRSTGDLTTTGSSNILIGDAVNASANNTTNELNIADIIYSADYTSTVQIGDGLNDANYTQFSATTGLQTLHGDARVTKYEWINASSINPLGPGGANAAKLTLSTNGWVIIEFTEGTDDYIQANMKIPDDMDLSAVSYVCIGWSSADADGDDCVWGYKYFITAAGDDTDVVGTSGTATITDDASVDGLVTMPILTIAGGTIQSDEICIHLQIYRDGDNAADTITGNVDMHGIALQYIADKHGTAL